MSTFIYQNQQLFADTRKIVNFPNREMCAIRDESKVYKLGWCYLACGGFELSALALTQILKSITVLESVAAVKSVLRECPKNGHLNSFLSAFQRYEESLKDAITKQLDDSNFLAVTRKAVYGNEGPLVLKKDSSLISVQTHHSVEVVGSAQNAARILLMNGVSPKDIYPILRSGGAPTGEHCEVFDIKDLNELQPPWLDRNVWIYAAVLISQFNNSTDQQKNETVDFITLIPKFGRTTKTGNYPKPNSVKNAMELWGTKSFRSDDIYQKTHERLFK